MNTSTKPVLVSGGKWTIVYGPERLNAGEQHPGAGHYDSLEEAVAAMRDMALKPGEERSADTSYDRYLLDQAPDLEAIDGSKGMLPVEIVKKILELVLSVHQSKGMLPVKHKDGPEHFMGGCE